ncbi:MAG: ThiF family adenylyltransferase [Crocosphaera sp.]
MCSQYLNVSGNLISPEEITTPKAKDIIQFLESEYSQYSRFIECRKSENQEIVVLDVDVELVQRRVNDIRHVERVAITFYDNDLLMPEILVLRDDFPAVPHINLRQDEFPRSLCLFDQPYSELKQRWTPFFLIERIREWLALTAKGTLHGEDQPLEPLLMSSGIPLIVPHDIFDQDESLDSLELWGWENANGSIILAAHKLSRDTEFQGQKYVAIITKAIPQKQGIIRKAPSNIEQLNEFLKIAGLDLIEKLHCKFKTWISDQAKLSSKLIIISYLPKLRDNNESIESADLWAFLTGETILKIGEDIGLWDVTKLQNQSCIHEYRPGLLLSPDTNKKGQDVGLSILNPTFTLSRSKAAFLNGISHEVQQPKIVAVGVGALGSQVFINSVRSGYGYWTIIDKDYLLPHNLSRHELSGFEVGHPKAHTLSQYARSIIFDDNIAKPIMADVLKPGQMAEELSKSYHEADLIIDMSASIAVARHLTFNLASNARRISIFLNPLGTDLVILAEDVERAISMDHIEAQYYREIILQPCLENHLVTDQKSMRYALSCRDLTSQISHDFVSLHSSIASRMIKAISKNKEAFLGVWQIDSESLNVSSFKKITECFIKLESSTNYESREWEIFTYPSLIEKILSFRQEKLPNETGGVFIGSYDFERKNLYVVDTILSPSDSVEKRNSYIRGKNQLKGQIEKISKKTSGLLEYVGEWHSHPNNCRVEPSHEDKLLFDFLVEEMSNNSLPTFMAIVGGKQKINFLFKGV